MGFIYQTFGKMKLAKEHLDKCLAMMVSYYNDEQHNELVDIYSILGHVNHALHYRDIAITYFENALNINVKA